MEAVGRRQQFAWALGLGALFFLVYGPVNAFTATRPDVPNLFLPWEAAIPFLPWMVLPYMSLDLFFVLAFFALHERTELHRHGLRVAVTILVSAALFLAFPLRFGFERPPVEGVLAPVFAALGLDLPYNQCPSLHISLALVIWPAVRRLVHGPARAVLALWFALIAASTLLVWQHHLIDLIGGGLVGLLVLQAIPLRDSAPTPVGARARRLAARWLTASALLTFAAAGLGGWALLLLWPAVTAALVGAAYLTGRSDYLAKRDGVHCAVIRLLFGPYLFAQWVNWAWYRRRDDAWVEVAPGLLIGRRLTNVEATELRNQGVAAVLDLSAELPEAKAWRGGAYYHIPWPDLLPPGRAQLDAALAVIELARANGPVYVHCTLGYGRSAAVAVAWLERQGLTPGPALERVRRLRRVVLARDEEMERITDYTEVSDHA